MSKKLGQEAAFPEPYLHDPNLALDCHPGMSKRFYAACAAMQGILANNYLVPKLNDKPIYWVVRFSYDLADELLKQEEE
jgi:hypothetical protein